MSKFVRYSVAELEKKINALSENWQSISLCERLNSGVDENKKIFEEYEVGGEIVVVTDELYRSHYYIIGGFGYPVQTANYGKPEEVREMLKRFFDCHENAFESTVVYMEVRHYAN